jgi:hypothetical protein
MSFLKVRNLAFHIHTKQRISGASDNTGNDSDFRNNNPEGHGFETSWVTDFFSIYLILPAALGPGIYSVSNRNEYQKHKKTVSGEYITAGE